MGWCATAPDRTHPVPHTSFRFHFFTHSWLGLRNGTAEATQVRKQCSSAFSKCPEGCTHRSVVALCGAEVEEALVVHGNQVGPKTATERQAGCGTHTGLHDCVLLQAKHISCQPDPTIGQRPHVVRLSRWRGMQTGRRPTLSSRNDTESAA